MNIECEYCKHSGPYPVEVEKAPADASVSFRCVDEDACNRRWEEDNPPDDDLAA